MARDGYIRAPVEVVGSRIRIAAQGPRSNKHILIEMIMRYIQEVAHREHDGNKSSVACPTEERWQQLASGHDALLPTITRLNLFADDSMRKLAAKTGGICQAYFAVAQYILRRSS